MIENKHSSGQALDLVQKPTSGTPVTIVLGNREELVNEMIENVLRQAYKDINFRFQAASRVGDFIQLATRRETRLALFIPPGNLQPDPGTSFGTPEGEAARILKTVKAKNPIPIIVMALQFHAREMLLAAGADVFLDIPPKAQEIVDAVSKCLGLEPKKIIPP